RYRNSARKIQRNAGGKQIAGGFGRIRIGDVERQRAAVGVFLQGRHRADERRVVAVVGHARRNVRQRVVAGGNVVVKFVLFQIDRREQRGHHDRRTGGRQRRHARGQLAERDELHRLGRAAADRSSQRHGRTVIGIIDVDVAERRGRATTGRWTDATRRARRRRAPLSGSRVENRRVVAFDQ